MWTSAFELNEFWYSSKSDELHKITFVHKSERLLKLYERNKRACTTLYRRLQHTATRRAMLQQDWLVPETCAAECGVERVKCNDATLSAFRYIARSIKRARPLARAMHVIIDLSSSTLIDVFYMEKRRQTAKDARTQPQEIICFWQLTRVGWFE